MTRNNRSSRANAADRVGFGVIVTMGIPGSGKTSLANWISKKECQFAVVSRDEIRDAMFRPCSFSREEKEAAFDALLIAVKVLLTRGTSVITDGMCLSGEGDLEKIKQVVLECGGRFMAVFCKCPIDAAEARVAEDFRLNRHTAKDRTPALVRKIALGFRALPADTFIVDTHHEISEAGEAVLSAWRLAINT